MCPNRASYLQQCCITKPHKEASSYHSGPNSTSTQQRATDHTYEVTITMHYTVTGWSDQICVNVTAWTPSHCNIAQHRTTCWRWTREINWGNWEEGGGVRKNRTKISLWPWLSNDDKRDHCVSHPASLHIRTCRGRAGCLALINYLKGLRLNQKQIMCIAFICTNCSHVLSADNYALINWSYWMILLSFYMR